MKLAVFATLLAVPAAWGPSKFVPVDTILVDSDGLPSGASSLLESHVSRYNARTAKGGMCVKSSSKVGCSAGKTTAKVSFEMKNSASKGGFEVRSSDLDHVVSAGDESGALQGFLAWIRQVRWSAKETQVPTDWTASHSSDKELWGLRGHQYSSAPHAQMFRTMDEMKDYTLDQAVFGTNQIEMAHISTSSSSYDHLVEFSSAMKDTGMNASLWISADKAAAFDLDKLFKDMKQLDSIFMPGGDGGTLDIKAATKARKSCRKYHPGCTMWISLQELSAHDMDSIIKELKTSTWKDNIDGIVFGPHVRVPLTQFVKMIPEGFPIRQYPDICHIAGAQFALNFLSHVWAFTHQRQAVAPSPEFMDSIVRQRANGSTPTIGVGAYSEGVGDDWNKAVWSGVAFQPYRSVKNIVADYARYYFGADLEETAAGLIFGLEQNWIGDPANNTQINKTFALAQKLEKDGKDVLAKSWRLQALVKRAYNDVYQQRRYVCGLESVAGAMSALQRTWSADHRLDEAEKSLEHDCVDKTMSSYKSRVLDLASAINKTLGAEVLQTQDKMLNIQLIDEPVSDVPFLLDQVKSIKKLKSDDDKDKAIAKLTGWTDPGKDGFYAALASVPQSPNLVLPVSLESDPARYINPTISGDRYHSSHWISSQRSVFELYDSSVVVRFEGLKSSAKYKLRVGWGGGSGEVQLSANKKSILQKYMSATSSTKEYSVPQSETKGGTLELECQQKPGVGGSGRSCYISEMWLTVESEDSVIV